MPHAVRSRAPVVVLILILSFIALPAFAGEQMPNILRGQSCLASLWQALADLIPGGLWPGSNLDPLGVGDQETNGSQGDLGPSLDPLG